MYTNTIRENGMNEFEREKNRYMRERGIDQRTAYYQVQKEQPELFRRYQYGEETRVKTYADLTPAQKVMALLQADPVRTQRLASWTLDHLAHQELGNVGEGVADPVGALKQAIIDIKNKFPNLARAAEDGFIGDGDYKLVSMLVPAVAGAVSRGEYSHQDSTRCPDCGENRAFCRGRKLAKQRHIREDLVAEFAQCIRDARRYGNHLDQISCYYE